MQKENQECTLCDYLDELGLGGYYWFIGQDEVLVEALTTQFSVERLHMGIPDSPRKLEQCSVLILDSSEVQSNESVLIQLSKVDARPLIIFLGSVSLTDTVQNRLHALGYQLPPSQPKGRPFRVVQHAELSHKKDFDVAGYWEKRYASGRDSGAGSYGRLARFKAQFLNHFVKQHEIRSVIELGCGDGSQLSLAEYPQYTGLDISPTVIEHCRRIFSHDSSKRFEIYDPKYFDTASYEAELGLSLDVIYHLSNDEVYRAYLEHLFAASSRFVIIYSNSEQGSRTGVNESAGYVRFRDVLSDINQWQPDWALVNAIPNRFPFSALNPTNTSIADFFVFEKQQAGVAEKPASASLEYFNTEKIINSLVVFDENAKKVSDGVVAANNKIEMLIDKVKSLEIAGRLQEQLNQANARFGEVSERYGKANQDITALQKERDAAITKLRNVEAKYRDANAKYRIVSQQLSALKSSQTYKAGLHLRAASNSLVDALKLPVRLWRLKRPQKNTSKQHISMQQGLRYIKWKAVVPLATRLGVPYNKVAYITLPSSLEGLLRHTKQKASMLRTRNQDGTAVKSAAPAQQSAAFTPPSPAAQKVSLLGWPEHPPNGKPYVIGIMDEFTTGCFEQEVNLIQPRPDNWYALAEKYPPALFFIESAWKGNYGSWQYRVADYANKPGQEVAHICQYAREKGIPTLFWNKEDPVHHDKFMCSAKLVDHIFTTDANMKASYRAKTGNHNVHALPFAAQPALHKPAPLAGRKPRSCFAGSWYGNRHAERGQAMRWLLQAANQHGLDIYDRNHGTGNFPFPEEYQAGIKGSLPYKELCDEYRRYRVFLNVNSVTDSPTMFSRRVFELMACGTPVVSTYAKGIENLFETDAVWMVQSQEEADEAIRTLMTDDDEWRRRSLAGIREVFAKHTYAHRLNDVFEQMGIAHRLPIDPSILLVAEAQGQEELEALNHFATMQSYHTFRLGIACPASIAKLAGSLSENIVLLQPDEKAAWVAEQQVDAPMAGWLSPYSHYGEHYLRDLANASIYEPDASGWAKSSGQDRFAYGESAVLCCALWKTPEFIKHYLDASPETRVTRPDLYQADSEQFQLEGLAKQPLMGAKS